jgi:hypothetical protein
MSCSNLEKIENFWTWKEIFFPVEVSLHLFFMLKFIRKYAMLSGGSRMLHLIKGIYVNSLQT